MIELEVMWMSLISTLVFMNDGWFIEMVQADVTVDEISCQQNLFPRLFSRKTQFSPLLWLTTTQHLS